MWNMPLGDPLTLHQTPEEHPMRDIRGTMRKVWSDLNPSEPSPWYLAKLMAFMVAIMALGLLIGAL